MREISIVTDLGNSELMRQGGWESPTIFSWCVDYTDPQNPCVGLTEAHEAEDIVAPAPTATEIMRELPTEYRGLHLRINKQNQKSGAKRVEYSIDYCADDGTSQFSTEAETLEVALARMWQWLHGDNPPEYRSEVMQTNVALLIYDYEEDFSKLTKFLGLRPTLTQEADQEHGLVRRWELRSETDESAELEEQLSILLKQLKPRQKEIREIARKYRCVISAGIHYYEFNPEIELTPETIQALADLGVKLWLDMYNMWDGESDHDYHEHSPEMSKL